MTNVGIIGAGRMGITHYSILNSHPEVKITSVADTSGMVMYMMKKHLDGLTTYKDYHKLIAEDKPDALIVCTPPNLHYPILKLAAENNIHVFVEKPYTTNFNQANELAMFFKAKGLINQVGYVNRFNDVFKKVKKIVESDVIGRIIRYRSEMFSCTISKPDDGNGWRGTRETGGGVIFEMSSHAIDLVNFIVGKPDKVIGTSYNSVFSKNVEDIVSSTFLYDSGTTGSIYINWCDESYRKPTNKLELFGEKGKILADQYGFKIFLKEENKNLGYRKGWNTIYITDIFEPVPFYVRGNEFTSQLYHFVDCIQGKQKSNICTFEEGAKTLDIIQKMFTDYESNGGANYGKN
ncbi:MAG: Gfo/Idh/MocA family oxidoreductase [bacterium]